MYKIVEKCTKHGIEVVKIYSTFTQAARAMAIIIEKYKKKARYYNALGFKAFLSQGNNMFLSNKP